MEMQVVDRLIGVLPAGVEYVDSERTIVVAICCATRWTRSTTSCRQLDETSWTPTACSFEMTRV
jgi:hypothetical protein